MKACKFCFFLLFILPVHVQAELKMQPKVVTQNGCPLSITEYDVYYSKVEKGLWHRPRYQNETERTMVAIEFRFVLIDVFEKFLSHHSHLEIEDVKPQSEKNKREAKFDDKVNVFHSRRFIDVGHTLRSYMYIYKIRFEDGEIWEYNEKEVIDQISPPNNPIKLENPNMEQVNNI